jgi:hypothetical protein
MARSPGTDGKGYTNPEVRFERADIQPRGIVLFGLVLGGGTLLVALAMTWFGNFLLRAEQPRKKTDLPEARVDADRLPPEPRLEGLEDVRQKNVRLFPPRARQHLQSQADLLSTGNEAKGILPIQTAIDDLAGKLPARKGPPPGTGEKR